MRTATRLALTLTWALRLPTAWVSNFKFVNSVFDTIIAAVTSGKCDIIMSAHEHHD